MDVNKIFGLFDTPDSSNDGLGINALDHHDLKKRMEFFDEFRDHPVVWIGMFKKFIINQKYMYNTLVNLFKTISNELDSKDVILAGDHIIYNRAYTFIQNLDINRELDLEVLKSNSSHELKISLESAIDYFEKLEEYEKCAFLLPILNIVKENLT